MLINLSNHPSSKWSKEQLRVATVQYGEIQDIPFPEVPPAATPEAIQHIVQKYIPNILKQSKQETPFVVHIMGEMTLVFRMVTILQQSDITCIASTSFRDTVEHPDGSKTFKFSFVQFRAYF